MLEKIIEIGRAGYIVVFALDWAIDPADPESTETWRVNIAETGEEPFEGKGETLQEAFDECYSEWSEAIAEEASDRE